MHKHVHAFCLLLLSMMCFAGCASPAKRAQKNVAVFHRLTPADQALVLRGKVRSGLDPAAVRIAWGEPDTVETSGSVRDSKNQPDNKSGGGVTEIWTYRHQVTVRGPLGSYDQWQPGNYYVPPGTSRFLTPGYGIGGQGYEGLLLYQPRVRYADCYVRRALFVAGKLVRYETYYGEFAPLP